MRDWPEYEMITQPSHCLSHTGTYLNGKKILMSLCDPSYMTYCITFHVFHQTVSD